MTETTTNVQQGAVETINSRLDTSILTRGRIVIVGQGGIGTILTRYLVLFIASLAEEFYCLLADGDTYSPNNSYRVDVPAFDNKAIAMASELNKRFGRPGLSLRAYPHYLNEANRREVIREGDCVFLCVDNHASRKIANDRVKELDDVVLISGGNDGVGQGERGTYGNVQVYVRTGGSDRAGSPLDRFHPEIAEPDDQNPDDIEDCMQVDESGVAQLLPVNLAVATTMLGALLRLLMPPKGERMYDEVCLDVLDATMLPAWLTGQ